MPKFKRPFRFFPQKGLALVSVLWLLVLLSTIVLSLVRESRLSLQATSVYSDELKVKADIQGAVYEFIYQMIYSNNELRALTTLSAQGYAVDISYEKMKLNINTASSGQLENYFKAHDLDAPDVLAARVIDFRDKDDDAREGGREEPLFQRLNVEASPKNSEYQHLYELFQVPGLHSVLNADILAGMTVIDEHRRGGAISLSIGKTLGRSRQQAKVTLRIQPSNEIPYEILRWDWTST